MITFRILFSLKLEKQNEKIQVRIREGNPSSVSIKTLLRLCLGSSEGSEES